MLSSQERTSSGGVAAEGLSAFVRFLDSLAGAQGLLLAVSGGPDSTALMHVAAAWRVSPNRPSVSVASVDHALRTEARAEAEAVVAAAGALGLPAVRLTWEGKKPDSGVPAAARDARYALLSEHAQAIGASHIVTAHTLDDQAETVLMRLAAGSGLTGLAAMESASERGTLTLARPFLEVRKAELVALCRSKGWAFFDDPSNRDPAYARSRWRRLAPKLAREGMTAPRVARFAKRVARADAALNHAASIAARAAHVSQSPECVRLDFARLSSEPVEIVIRVLSAALLTVGGFEQSRLERLERLIDALCAHRKAGATLRRTLHRCVVILDRKGGLSLLPEGERRRGQKAALQHNVAFRAGHRLDVPASLGKPRPASYIGIVDATTRLTEVVEPHSAPAAPAIEPMLCTGPQ